MDEESRQKRFLILLAAIVCAVMIGYNAFYVPDATVVWAQNSSTVSEESDSSGSGESLQESAALSSKIQEAQSRDSASLSQSSAASKVSGKININTASAQELSDGLNGIGEVLSKRIVEYREKNGSFHSIEEIKNVSGIGDKIFEKIQDSITV